MRQYKRHKPRITLMDIVAAIAFTLTFGILGYVVYSGLAAILALWWR